MIVLLAPVVQIAAIAGAGLPVTVPPTTVADPATPPPAPAIVAVRPEAVPSATASLASRTSSLAITAGSNGALLPVPATPAPVQYALFDAQAAEPAQGEPTPAQAAPTAAAAPEAAAADAPAATAEPSVPVLTADETLIDGRRRPGVQEGLPERITQDNAGAVSAPPPDAFPTDQIAVPDRWRLVQALCPDKNFPGVHDTCRSILDPYHQNFLKGDRPINPKDVPWLPIHGDDWFLVASAISDTVVEPRSFPTPINRQDVSQPGGVDVFGRDRSLVVAQTFIVGASLLKGSTAFKPPDIEYRVALAYQANYVDIQERRALFVQPSKPTHRYDSFLGVQELFVDKHLGNRSERFDFDSLRVGIQPINLDFRGFLFQDSQLGIRLFGNRDGNRFQYNLMAFWRLEKDTNSGLNDVTQTPRKDFILAANLFRQDFPIPGITSQVSATLNINREKHDLEIDHNGFPVRPVLLGNLEGRNYEIFYPGYSFDGRIGRINLTGSLYGAFGRDSNSFFTGRSATIAAYFGAVEASYDTDFLRFRASALYASGDNKPYNNTETGFDAIFENPIFAGADTSYWIRQSIPFAGGGRVVNVSQRNGILNDLRSSKEQGQSNFNNPGTMLLGVGTDADVLPQLRISANVNHLWFENTSGLKALRTEGSIPRSIGFDYSVAAIYRPSAVQNAVFRLSAAVLEPSKGFRDLFTNSQGDGRYYSVLLNVILSF